MTAPTVDRDAEGPEAPWIDTAAVGLDAPTGPDGEERATEAEEHPEVPLRPLLVAAFSSIGAALMVGGIFGSWGARLLGTVAALGGVAWVWVSLRSPSRRALYQLLVGPGLLVLAVASVAVAAPGGAGNLPHLIHEAIKAGRNLRPPIPFDAGWRPIIIVVLGLIGYGAGFVGAALDRPQTALLIPLPVLGMTAIYQPKSDQALAGVLAVVPIIAALAVMFGGDGGGVSNLSRQFELRRTIRAVAAMVPAVGLLLLLNSTSVLFPKPAYDPTQKPQKPKAVPLSAAQDRVLFEIDSSITGPWHLGDLDVYDGRSWKLPPYDPRKLQHVGGDGVIDKARHGDVTAKFTVRDLGESATLPGVVGPIAIHVPSGTKVVYDARSATFRMPSGRVPSGLTYTVDLAKYPAPDALHSAPALTTHLDKDLTAIPPPPAAVQGLLDQAPANPWDRLNFLLTKLNSVVVAVGAGIPVDVPPQRVQELLAGNHEGSPYEIVAAQAMLARWAGVPSRIGFGFDGDQQEGGVFTVRPRNASQWMEAYFEGYGWIPVVLPPKQAKADLNNDKNQRFNPTIQAGSDVAVEVYIPVKVKTLRALYQQIRDVLLFLLPFALLVLGAYLLTPWAMRTWRRVKRRRWAAAEGPQAAVAVEYAEFRDLATDLGVGDPYATPLQYLGHVVDDEQHAEFAWLVARVLYGDLAGTVGHREVAASRDLSTSLQQRLAKGQPLQTRVLAFLSRASLNEPYTTEVPSVRTVRRRLALGRRAGTTARRLGRWLRRQLLRVPVVRRLASGRRPARAGAGIPRVQVGVGSRLEWHSSGDSPAPGRFDEAPPEREPAGTAAGRS